MNPRVAVLKQLVADDGYPIDEAAVAEAILVRSLARRILPDLSLRIAPPKPPVRSFRHHSGARSFRLARPERRSSDGRVTPLVVARTS